MSETSLSALSAAEAARKIRAGEVKSSDLVNDLLERVREVDGDIAAWAHLRPEHALAQAELADRAWSAGRPMGPLHGVPIGVKDIIDTADYPTENGTPLQAGRAPEQDAFVVSMLRQAGAVIMGKTVTTELAVYSPGKTRNPHDPGRTPGGSSSGSAAAVGAFMLPAAVGTQTNGSLIRPASYCGVYGFKPTHGKISRTGILPQSRWLDTVGVMARSLEDVALVTSTLMQFDPSDPDMRPAAAPPLLEVAASEPPVEPDLVFLKTRVWDDVEADTRDGFSELLEFLGDCCEENALPEPYDDAWQWHRTIMYSDLAHSFAPFYETGAERLSGTLRGMIEEGRDNRVVDYHRALDWRRRLRDGLDAVFDEFDAIITPAAFGQAPAGLDSTGSPACCTLWTLVGAPAISLPLMEGSDGMPIGVQMVGRPGNDARLLRTANWLVKRVNEA